MDPHLEQDKGQGNKYEARGRIRCGGPPTHPPRTPGARLDAEPPPVQMAGVARREVRVELDEYQPLRPSPQPVGATSRSEHATDHDLGRVLPPLRPREGIRRARTLTPLAQGTSPALPAPDRASAERGLPLSAKGLQGRNPGKAFVQQQAADRYPPSSYLGEQRLQDADRRVGGQDKAERHGQAQPLEAQVGRGNAVEARGAV